MDTSATDTRPDAAPASSSARGNPPPQQQARTRKNHRGEKKKRSRKKSFAAAQDEPEDSIHSPGLTAIRDNFYSLHGRGISNTSLESEALLDHRDQSPFLRTRRGSVLNPATASFQPGHNLSGLRATQVEDSDQESDHLATPWAAEQSPLLSVSAPLRGSQTALPSIGYGSNEQRRSRPGSGRESSRSSSKRKFLSPFTRKDNGYNVNYPPSVPGSPSTRPSDRAEVNFGDVLFRDALSLPERSPRRRSLPREDAVRMGLDSMAHLHPHPSSLERRHTIALQAEEDVCFPQEGMSEMADDELQFRRDSPSSRARVRRRRRKWPDLAILDEWSRIEKEGRSEERRTKKITEPQLINGRLRPVHKGWYRTEEDAPYRFTYFNVDAHSTIHSQSMSELAQAGGSFKELFIPDPPVLSDSSDDEESGPDAVHEGLSKGPTRQPSMAMSYQTGVDNSRRDGGVRSPVNAAGAAAATGHSTENSGFGTPAGTKTPPPQQEPKPRRYGERSTWWLDVYAPTDAEMRVLSKTFGIHPLTAEDIMCQEQREKVELFRNYYFVSYRTFDQDTNSENFMEPVNYYVVVFREGVVSFHFSMTPHGANVRRRIRQLRDYVMITSDWISYAIIDDITDVFVPLIENIEEEVDDIDDAILKLHSRSDPSAKRQEEYSKEKSEEEGTTIESGSDMLRRVGDCRKRVMVLYRLLGNKADVVKGFAKRCNEHWEVAPRSEIGLYLGDIQDHIVTMTANLGHYEKILARSHANYLAQINIVMNERQEQTAHVLGRLTVLGTIVLPMNIITGLWGMNVWVPGQEYDGDLRWFAAITAGLVMFGLACYLIAKRVYKIV